VGPRRILNGFIDRILDKKDYRAYSSDFGRVVAVEKLKEMIQEVRSGKA
jgi:hypothetical protein